MTWFGYLLVTFFVVVTIGAFVNAGRGDVVVTAESSFIGGLLYVAIILGIVLVGTGVM